MASGPITLTDSSSRSCVATRCFVTWSATTAAAATAISPAHCHAPAPSGRSATETGSSAFVAEPTRMSGARCGSRSLTLALPAVRAPLVVDAERRPGAHAQPLLGDRLAAALAGAVRAVVEPRERAVDLGERLLGALAEALVEL